MTLLQRKSLLSQLAPLVDVRQTLNEIRIVCDRFHTPRFIELERENFCRKCPPDVDYLVASDGIYVQSDRINGGEKFVPFDHIIELPQYCAFRVRGRKLFKFVHVFPDPKNNGKIMKRKTEKTNPNDAPILTTILPHLISQHEEPIKEEPTQPDDVPILTTVLPHLITTAEQKEQTMELPMENKEEDNKDANSGDDGIPLLTTILPHLESHL